jgi:anaerobic ribonucleoside-triphosphate reductase activating protein
MVVGLMNLAGTEYTLESRSFDIFVSGCTRKCPGCFNPEAQEFDFGERLVIYDLLKKMVDCEDIIDNIRIMGGDLLCQPEDEAKDFSEVLRLAFPKIFFVLYTGAELEDIPEWCFEIFDAIKYGRYVRELHCNNPLFGSSNQVYMQKDIYGRWPS